MLPPRTVPFRRHENAVGRGKRRFAYTPMLPFRLTWRAKREMKQETERELRYTPTRQQFSFSVHRSSLYRSNPGFGLDRGQRWQAANSDSRRGFAEFRAGTDSQAGAGTVVHQPDGPADDALRGCMRVLLRRSTRRTWAAPVATVPPFNRKFRSTPAKPAACDSSTFEAMFAYPHSSGCPHSW